MSGKQALTETRKDMDRAMACLSTGLYDANLTQLISYLTFDVGK